jgi:hypothetical protein
VLLLILLKWLFVLIRLLARTSFALGRQKLIDAKALQFKSQKAQLQACTAKPIQAD